MIIPLVIAAALLVGGSFAAVKFWPNATTADPEPESSATTESQSPSIAESSPSPSTTASSTTQPANAAATKALEACQKKVEAADAVLKQGKIGVLHWAEHVQAQKDNLSGKVTVEEMKARFKKTRLKGPGDLKRYSDALSTYGHLEGSCAKVKGADHVVAATLAKCEKRSKAQQPVMKATAAGMQDWKNHQKFMQRNALHKVGTPSEAQSAWLKQYKAAPKNINAFKKAYKNFEAPSC
ncbi:MAG TPA: hypothetical protein VI094_04405 [Propionibacteriaceae bacterium]